jgi:hypothetical protein
MRTFHKTIQDRFGDHQLAAACRSQLKARVQASSETLQEFAAAVDQMAHLAFVGLPVFYSNRSRPLFHRRCTGQEDVTLWRPGAQLKSARLCFVGDEVISAWRERVVMAKLEAPLGATKVLLEPSRKCSRDGVFIARALVRARLKVPVRIMNVINQDQVMSEGTTIGHGEPAV